MKLAEMTPIGADKLRMGYGDVPGARDDEEDTLDEEEMEMDMTWALETKHQWTSQRMILWMSLWMNLWTNPKVKCRFR